VVKVGYDIDQHNYMPREMVFFVLTYCNLSHSAGQFDPVIFLRNVNNLQQSDFAKLFRL